MRKYYQILGLEPGATKDEIKKAYRKKALKYHPDLNKGADAHRKFMEVLEAYEYLMGIRKVKAPPQVDPHDIERLYELLRKRAEERARQRYRQRVQELRRKKEEQQSREYQKAIYSLIGIAILAVTLWKGYDFYHDLRVQQNPVYTEAEVVGLASNRMIYEFNTAAGVVQDRQYVSNVGIQMLAGNGLPLKIGDRFELVYNRDNPAFHEVNFRKVSSATMKRYLKTASLSLQQYYREDWKDLEPGRRNIISLCMSMLIFEKYQFKGLSKVIFYDANLLDNFSSNSFSWYRMRNSSEFQEIISSCRADSLY